MPIHRRRTFHHEGMRPHGVWGIRPRFHGLSPCGGQVAYVLLTSAPVAAIDVAINALPLDLHVLSLSLAFILSQDQTLRCCISFSSFQNLLSKTRYRNASSEPEPGVAADLLYSYLSCGTLHDESSDFLFLVSTQSFLFLNYRKHFNVLLPRFLKSVAKLLPFFELANFFCKVFVTFFTLFCYIVDLLTFGRVLNNC